MTNAYVVDLLDDTLPRLGADQASTGRCPIQSGVMEHEHHTIRSSMDICMMSQARDNRPCLPLSIPSQPSLIAALKLARLVVSSSDHHLRETAHVFSGRLADAPR